jgi:hypothetical protein
MEFRLGTCTNCKNSFRVPATFTAAKAKCPKCQGVVEIGPVQGAAPAAASTETPKPVPASVPPARPAAAAPAASAPKPAAPAPQPSAAPKAPAPKPAAAAAKPAAPAPKPAAAAARPAAKESVRSAAQSAAKRVKGKEDDDEGGSRRGRGSRGSKQKSWGPMVGAMAFLVVMGGVAYWYFKIKLPQEHTEAKERAEAEALKLDSKPTEPTSDTAGTNAPTSEPTPEPVGDASAKPSDTSEPAAAKAPEPEKPAEPAKEPAAPKADSTEVVDLSAIPDLERLAGTSDADWTKYQDLVKTMLDPNAGAKGSRAAGQLVEIGKPAFPAILNGFKRLDLTTEDGFRMADMTQKTLERLCNGNNFGWHYQHQKDYLNYDRKAIKAWIGAWERAKDDEAFWLKLTKQTEKKPAEGEAEGKSGSGLDDF